MDMLFSLAELKIIQSNHGVFKNFAIKQSESSFNGHKNFNKFNVNLSELSSSSHLFFNNFDIKQLSIPSQVIFVVITNQNEVFTHFKILCRSELNHVYETSQSISFIELVEHN